MPDAQGRRIDACRQERERGYFETIKQQNPHEALAEVTRAVCEGRVDVVLVKKLSRIGREYDMVQSYIQLLSEHKVTLLYVSDELEISNRNLYLYPRFEHKKTECP